MIIRMDDSQATSLEQIRSMVAMGQAGVLVPHQGPLHPATRMPNSRVRCATVYAITPATPTTASTSASPLWHMSHRGAEAKCWKWWESLRT